MKMLKKKPIVLKKYSASHDVGKFKIKHQKKKKEEKCLCISVVQNKQNKNKLLRGT